MGSIIRRLLSLPGGISFRKLNWTRFSGEDLSLMMALVKRCSHTLESLDATCYRRIYLPILTPIDLSKATKLKGVVFQLGCQDLDHLFIQLWESHSIRPRIVYMAEKDTDMRDCIECLLTSSNTSVAPGRYDRRRSAYAPVFFPQRPGGISNASTIFVCQSTIGW